MIVLKTMFGRKHTLVCLGIVNSDSLPGAGPDRSLVLSRGLQRRQKVQLRRLGLPTVISDVPSAAIYSGPRLFGRSCRTCRPPATPGRRR